MRERLAVAAGAGHRRVDHADAARARAPRGRGRARRSRARRSASSRRMPPLPTEPRGASNCGLISASRSPPGAEARQQRRHHQPQRDERHVDGHRARSARGARRRRGGARCAPRAPPRADRCAARSRAGRGRRRARRRARAPRCSRQSVKPPVPAPTSRQTRPAGSIAKWSSAAASLRPARETNGSRGPATSRRASTATAVPALSTRRPSTSTAAGHHRPPRLLAALEQAALDQQQVELGSSSAAGSRPSSPRSPIALPEVVDQRA